MAKILVADDNDVLRNALVMTLEQMGYDVEEAPNGKVALDLQKKFLADVLLTDLIMPEKEGLEIIQEFRRRYPSVIIIAMSAGGRIHMKDLLKVAKQLGANFALSKPFSNDELAETLNKALVKQEA
ncbi:MAG TPA: response regulator [Verrucomicrobiae bacterium]